ncbi:MAG: DUF2953 domain-containing protein [Paracoccaceae bacterium]|nr:DUF2953 domain-containing protein [Paracoccaceae bacterium]
MWVFGWVALGALGAVLGLILALLCLPIILIGEACAGERTSLSLRARAFGGLAPPIELTGKSDKPRKKEKKKEKRREKKKPRRFGGGRNRGSDMIAALPRLIGGLLSAVYIDRLELDADFGLEDPAETGHLYGLLCPVLYGFPPSPRRRIAIRPVFGQTCFRAEAKGAVRVTPVALLPPVAGFVWQIWGPKR